MQGLPSESTNDCIWPLESRVDPISPIESNTCPPFFSGSRCFGASLKTTMFFSIHAVFRFHVNLPRRTPQYLPLGISRRTPQYLPLGIWASAGMRVGQALVGLLNGKADVTSVPNWKAAFLEEKIAVDGLVWVDGCRWPPSDRLLIFMQKKAPTTLLTRWLGWMRLDCSWCGASICGVWQS